ncbi:hypothetical protein [Pedobacter sp. L105]|uniref:hypothetical protein n=1 Tax=Pedobacter sp. L105 TaxID=1641871 RepID=UPI00131CEB8A|nr:hypothetical protein [Pedobacter sp. L105]
MPQFNSKVQHKTYEKGEFTDEKDRSLADTLELINTFPWDMERTLTAVQLTGPSVTIRDEDVNYLKIGLFFNGKYCLYYLDNDNHLYEYHAQEMEDVSQMVTNFFNSALDLSLFEKHLINIGNKAHFETCYFEYRENPWRILMLNVMLLVYAVLLTIGDVALFFKYSRWPGGLVLGIASVLFYYFIFRIFYNAFVNRDNYLQISRGSDVFSFGYTSRTVNVYHKTEIKEIRSYGNRGPSKNPNLIEAFEIVFKNDETIQFTNMLIGSFDFHSKFQDSMSNPTILFSPGKKGFLKVL